MEGPRFGGGRSSSSLRVVNNVVMQWRRQRCPWKGSTVAERTLREVEGDGRADRVLVLGGSGVLTGPGPLTMATRVQCPARVRRLFVVGRGIETGVLDPASYRITDIRVGTKSQLRSLGPLPGIMFSPDVAGHGHGLCFDEASPGVALSVSVVGPPISFFSWGALVSVCAR